MVPADAAPADAVLSDEEFTALMAGLGPFEPAPHLAVAVSGGADSLALVLLAARWAQARGGDITALTVDHRLRPAATVEVAQVGAWLAARGIRHATLTRAGPSLRSDVQAQARAARYDLLESWCAAAGVLHLLVAHHAEDQGETVLLRLARGSGLDGLAGMAAVEERRDCRRLRPLLAVPRRRLVALLEAAGQAWIEDPSNRDPAYQRVRLRALAPALAAEGLTTARLGLTAAALGRARAVLEEAVAAWVARAALIHPAGYAWLEGTRLAAAPAEVALRGLAALLTTIGGAEYPPRLDSLARVHRRLAGGPAGAPIAESCTLGGCRLVPWRGGVLICREPRAVAPEMALRPGSFVWWDRRFRVGLPAAAPEGLRLGALGLDRPAGRDRLLAQLPGPVRPALPALRDAGGLVALPATGYSRPGAGLAAAARPEVRFDPNRPLTRLRFTVV